MTGTALLALTTALFTTTRPNTNAHAWPDTGHFRRVWTDTVQEIVFTSAISTDRRIRLSLVGGSLGTPIVTAWMDAATVRQWVKIVHRVSSEHEFALTDEPTGCEGSDADGPPPDSVAGHLFALGSSVAVTPMNVRKVPIYKIDVMDADQDRTATFGVTAQEQWRLVKILEVAEEAARVLSDDELRRDGPLTVHAGQRVKSWAPPYPEVLLQARIEGQVNAWFVIDSTGVVDMRTFHARQSTDPEFTRAVRMALPRGRFTPASIEGHPYRACVVEPFTFTLQQ